MQDKQRNIALDILRICCMCMIITLHFFSYSNVNDYIPRYSELFWTKSVINAISGVSVNCFVLISGYFAINTKFKISKLLTLMREVFVYSVVIYLLLTCTGTIPFKIKDMLFSVFPSLTRQYWFITTYLGLYILSPHIKILVQKLSKREFLSALLTGFMLFVVYYNLFFFCDNLNFGGGAGILWFIYMYLCGIYIKLHVQRKNAVKKNLFIFLAILILNLSSRVPFYILNIITDKEIFFLGAPIFGSVYNSIFLFIQSLAFFWIFVDLDIRPVKPILVIVRILSESALATYLIHDNTYFRNVLWSRFDFTYINNSIELIISLLGIIVGIYVVACFIDFIRTRLDKRIWSNELNDKLDVIYEAKVNSLMNLLERL